MTSHSLVFYLHRHIKKGELKSMQMIKDKKAVLNSHQKQYPTVSIERWSLSFPSVFSHSLMIIFPFVI